MALTAACESYLGRRLLVEPDHGYGWISQLATVCSAVEVPAPFHFVVDRFFWIDGALMGGIGTIHEPGHLLDQLQLGFSVRRAADHDFVDDPVTCSLTVGCKASTAQGGWVLAQGPPALVGSGRLRDDSV
jgi:hypothetical protein